MLWELLALLGLTIFLIWCLSSPFYWRIRNVPHLTPFPIFGNYFSILTKGVLGFNKNLYHNFPGKRFYGLHMFVRPALFIKDPELIQKILVTDYDYFTSHGMYANQDVDPVGGNLFHIQGQQWKEMRGKISPYFTPARVKTMIGYVDKTILKATRTIDKNILMKQPTDLKQLLISITTDVITQCILGIEADSFDEKDSVFNTINEEMFNSKLTFRMFLSMISPKLIDLFHVQILETKVSRKIIDIVKKTVDYRRKENVQLQDYLQGMMEMVDNHRGEEQEPKYFPDNTRKPKYDINTLIAQAVLLLAAGIETSSLTLTHFFYEIAIRNVYQEKCREEIRSVCKETGSNITVNDLPKLVYLGAALQETLRLHTPLSMLSRGCTRNYKIPNTDVIIEKGTLILMSSVGLHYDPKYFPNPEVFKPERFLNGNKIQPGTYYPFGLGPKTCLGLGLANSEMKFIVAKFLERYEFSVCSKTDVPCKPAKYYFLKTPANGMWLKVRPIEEKI